MENASMSNIKWFLLGVIFGTLATIVCTTVINFTIGKPTANVTIYCQPDDSNSDSATNSISVVIDESSNESDNNGLYNNPYRYDLDGLNDEERLINILDTPGIEEITVTMSEYDTEKRTYTTSRATLLGVQRTYSYMQYDSDRIEFGKEYYSSPLATVDLDYTHQNNKNIKFICPKCTHDLYVHDANRAGDSQAYFICPECGYLSAQVLVTDGVGEDAVDRLIYLSLIHQLNYDVKMDLY